MTPPLAETARELAQRLRGSAPAEMIRFALSEFGGDVRIGCSFGVEDMVVVHEASRVGAELGVVPRVFLLDTGRPHQETYDLVERVRGSLSRRARRLRTGQLAVEDLLRRKGPNSFYRSVDDRRECCAIRKVRPLRRALAGARAWITGMRRDQSPTRDALEVVELDTHAGARDTDGLLKLNPLASWTEADVWAFVAEHGVPTHALHQRGYPSIGCAPCTRPVRAGEEARAGRWWWEDAEHKECGLHPSARHAARA